MDIENVLGIQQQTNENTFVQEKVIVTLKQRNAKKCITSVENLPTDKLKDIKTKYSKKYNINASIKNNVLILTGDQRSNLRIFLQENNILVDIEIKG